jgi:competence ComEA-like helix-hairpin-helix protein
MVCAIVLGVAAILGLGWSLKHQTHQQEQIQTAADHKPIKLLIDLNSADPHTLELLPSIGPKIAERIVEDRELNGPYESIEDLDRVSGIGPKTIDRVQDWVMVSPP